MPLLPHVKEPFNEGGRILIARVELRVTCIWTLLISVSYFNCIRISGYAKNGEEKMCAVFNDNTAKKIKVMCPEGKGSEEICSEEKHALKINL